MKTFYDTNAPLGISVKGGKIIEKPELINASNDYLKSNISIANYLPEKVNFPQVILESGEYFTIKLLLLHHVNVTPQLMPIGKIAGQNEIKVINATEPVQNKSFWVEAFEGNIWIHLARSVAYFLAILVLIILLIIFSVQVSDYKEKKRKKRRIKEFKARESFEYNKMDDAIFDRYKADGISNFKRMIYFTEDEEKLNDRYQDILEELKDKDHIPNEDPIHEISNGRVIYKPDKDLEDWSIINDMIKDGILIKNGKDLSVNQPLKKTLEEFVNYLEEKEEFKKITNSTGRIIKNGYVI